MKVCHRVHINSQNRSLNPLLLRQLTIGNLCYFCSLMVKHSGGIWTPKVYSSFDRLIQSELYDSSKKRLLHELLVFSRYYNFPCY
jgi:hypothetical protein